MPESNAYTERWRNLRRREWLVIALLIGYLPVVGLMSWLIRQVTTSEIPPTVVAIAWMGASAWAALRVGLFPCPRCGKRFYMNKYLMTTMGRKCPHCGVHRYAK
jgi:DNA-directed RNA polymerase subunit RPC12/RpoP